MNPVNQARASVISEQEIGNPIIIMKKPYSIAAGTKRTKVQEEGRSDIKVNHDRIAEKCILPVMLMLKIELEV